MAIDDPNCPGNAARRLYHCWDSTMETNDLENNLVLQRERAAEIDAASRLPGPDSGAGPSGSGGPDQHNPNPRKEKKAKTIAQQAKAVTCLNSESLDAIKRSVYN